MHRSRSIATHCIRGIVFGAAAATLIAGGVGCRRGESNPHAAFVAQQGHETAEILENQAQDMARGPDDPVTRRAIEDLRVSARNIQARAEEQAADIRAHAWRGRNGARGGGPVLGDAAHSSVVNARCEYEAQCGNVGPGRRYETADACVQLLGHDRFMGWSPAVCDSRPFRNDALYACLSAIRAQQCSAMDTAMLTTFCEPARVCPAP
jgi:hypothetical protein